MVQSLGFHEDKSVFGPGRDRDLSPSSLVLLDASPGVKGKANDFHTLLPFSGSVDGSFKVCIVVSFLLKIGFKVMFFHCIQGPFLLYF